VDVTTGANGDCVPDDMICVDITDTIEANLFDSGPLQTADDESICVQYDYELTHVSKTPMLAWAGQRVVLSHDWSDLFPGQTGPCGEEEYVLYSVQAGPGSFTAALYGNDAFVASQTGQDAIVQVDGDCTSHVIFENQDQAQNDIIAYVVDGPDLSTATPQSQQVPFVIYYLKFEDVELTLVPGERAGHNDGIFDADTDPVQDSSNDVTDLNGVNVSADVLARLRVRGWVTTTNCPARDSGVGANGEFLPANRCIFPDDWRFKAGGGVGDSLNDPALVAGFAEDSRPNFDTDEYFNDDPATDPMFVINAWDAPMPPALVSFELSGSGFLRPTDKDDVYPITASNITNNPLYSTRIPASDMIAPINADLSGYQWDGDYEFWTDLADHGPEVLSCAGPNPCTDGVPTGGYLYTKVYTDNHGEAMTWINGDADLDFGDCAATADDAGDTVVLLSGYICANGTAMGESALNASVDYPDKRKHFAIQADEVTIDWTWGGIKEVEVVAGAAAQFNYIVFSVTDRDGFCDADTSLHPVLGENVTFFIDSLTAGTIFPDVNGNAAAELGSWTSFTADVTTFDAGANALIAAGGITVIDNDACQAWIHITESLLGPVNVIITAYDPEGTVTFDVIVNPVVEPTPEPPFTLDLIWGDTDCDGDVGTRDSQAILRNVLDQSALSQTPPCLEIGEAMSVVGHDGSNWADWDCDGSVGTRDSQSILRNVLEQTALSQTGDCPTLGDTVTVQPLVP